MSHINQEYLLNLMYFSRLGHLLFTSPGHATSPILSPPLKGSYPFKGILEWIRDEKVQPTFIPRFVPLQPLASWSTN